MKLKNCILPLPREVDTIGQEGLHSTAVRRAFLLQAPNTNHHEGGRTFGQPVVDHTTDHEAPVYGWWWWVARGWRAIPVDRRRDASVNLFPKPVFEHAANWNWIWHSSINHTGTNQWQCQPWCSYGAKSSHLDKWNDIRPGTFIEARSFWKYCKFFMKCHSICVSFYFKLFASDPM